MTPRSPIPAARDDDPEDVSWALSTAATQWARGDRVEAFKWLRRAAEAASEAGQGRARARAREGRGRSHDAVDAAAVDAAARAVFAPRAFAFASGARRDAEGATGRAVFASARGRAEAGAVEASAAAVEAAPPPAKAPQAKKATAKPAGKSADETSKRGALATSGEGGTPQLGDEEQARDAPARAAPDEKTDTHVVTEVTRLDAKPPQHTPPADADAWPTESMGGEELDSLHKSGEVYGTGAHAHRPPAFRPSDPPPVQNVQFRASQAVHVILWRDADGHLRVAPRGTTVSAVTIEVLLVAPSADVDLLAWLSPDLSLLVERRRRAARFGRASICTVTYSTSKSLRSRAARRVPEQRLRRHPRARGRDRVVPRAERPHVHVVDVDDARLGRRSSCGSRRRRGAAARPRAERAARREAAARADDEDRRDEEARDRIGLRPARESE